jgi:EamA-like transporter family protein
MDQLAPFAFVLLWSSSFVSTRAGLNYVSPLAFVTLRLGLCALVLLAIMAGSRQRFAPLAGNWQRCAIAGALINGVMLASSHWGLVSGCWRLATLAPAGPESANIKLIDLNPTRMRAVGRIGFGRRGVKTEDAWLSPLCKILPTAQITLSASGYLGRKDGENLPPYRSHQPQGGA